MRKPGGGLRRAADGERRRLDTLLLKTARRRTERLGAGVRREVTPAAGPGTEAPVDPAARLEALIGPPGPPAPAPARWPRVAAAVLVAVAAGAATGLGFALGARDAQPSPDTVRAASVQAARALRPAWADARPLATAAARDARPDRWVVRRLAERAARPRWADARPLAYRAAGPDWRPAAVAAARPGRAAVRAVATEAARSRRQQGMWAAAERAAERFLAAARQQATAPGKPRRKPEPAGREGRAEGFRVQIAAMNNRAALARERARLRALAPDLLADRPTDVVPGLRMAYRLQVGRFDDRAAAAAYCRRLMTRGISCLAPTRKGLLPPQQ